MATSRCRLCDAPILWVTTQTGKKMPVDSVPVQNGTLVLTGGGDKLFSHHATPEERDKGVPLYLSHFASCPNADAFRNSGTPLVECPKCGEKFPARRKQPR